MKKLFLAFCCILLIGKEGNSQEKATPVIKVDYEHWQIKRKNVSKPLKYEIPICEGFVLDAAEVVFMYTPNLIWISLEKDSQYGIAWKPQIKRYFICKETLLPLENSKPFPGFKAGQEIIINIGYIDLATGDYYTYWCGWVKMCE